MGRLKVTAKGKVKKNIPITRIGKKQYLKRRFAHVRAVDVAGADNKLTQKFVAGEHFTAAQSFAHLGLRMDASAPVETLKAQHLKIPESKRKVDLFEQEEQAIKAQEEFKKANYIARPVSEQESSMIGALLHTYGMDIKRMTYDHKLNPFQLNARQLQRQIVNYLKWEKAAFPKQFEEAERRGWFSVEGYADPKLRFGIHQKTQTSTSSDAANAEPAATASPSTDSNAPQKKSTNGEKVGQTSSPKKQTSPHTKKGSSSQDGSKASNPKGVSSDAPSPNKRAAAKKKAAKKEK